MPVPSFFSYGLLSLLSSLLSSSLLLSALLLRPAPAAAAGYAWRDWDKRQVCHPTSGAPLQPASASALAALVRGCNDMARRAQSATPEGVLHSTTRGGARAAAAACQIKVVGAGHSFSPIALTDDDRLPPPSSSSSSFSSLLVNLDRLDRVLELPPPPAIDGSASLPPTVHVEAGIRVHQLNAALLAAGWALENTGAIAMQSVAGATQTGTHGTGSALSSMFAQADCSALFLREVRGTAPAPLALFHNTRAFFSRDGNHRKKGPRAGSSRKKATRSQNSAAHALTATRIGASLNFLFDMGKKIDQARSS